MRTALASLVLTGCLSVPPRPSDHTDAAPDTTPSDAACTFGPWSTPQLVPNVGTAYEEFGAALAPDGSELVFVHNEPSMSNRLFVSQVAITGPTFTVPLPLFGSADAANPGWRSDGGLLYVTLFGSQHEASVFHPGPPPSFDPLMSTSDLDAIGTFERPSFTADGLDLYVELYGTVFQIGHAHRAVATDPWPAPTPVDELDDVAANSETPAIRADGLEILFASDRGGGNAHLYEAHRSTRAEPFSTPMPVSALGDGIRPSMTRSGTFLVFDMYSASNGFELFYATRACN